MGNTHTTPSITILRAVLYYGRATSVDAAKIHRILVLIEEIRRRIRRRRWIYGYPVKDPVERIGTRYEAALKDLAVVSKQMESVVRREIKKNR